MIILLYIIIIKTSLIKSFIKKYNIFRRYMKFNIIKIKTNIKNK